MPSRLHAVYARVVPRVRKAEEMGGPEPEERARVVSWHATLDRTLPTRAVPGFHRRFSMVREELGDPGAGFPAYVLTPRGGTPQRTLFYLHGGGYMAPIDQFQVRYITRLATASRRPRGDARLPAGARAHLARQPRRRRRAGRALGERARRDRAGGRLVRRRLRAGRRHGPSRPRPPAGDPPAAARAVGRPDDQHARDRLLRRGRPVAVHRQAARVRRCGGPAAPRTSAARR